MPDTYPAARIAIHAASGSALYQFCLPLIDDLARRGHRVITLSKQDSFFPLLEQKGIAAFNTQSTEDKIAIVSIIRYIAAVRRILKQERPHLIHLMSPKAIFFITALARLMHIKTVCVFTGLGYIFTLPRYHPARIAATWGFRIVLKAAHRVVFLNRDDIDYFVRARIVMKHKARLIRSSGIDMQKYQRTGSAYPKIPTFVFVGRLMLIKGVVRFLDAACAIHAGGRAARFIVIGSNRFGNRKMITDEQIAHYRSLLGDAVEFVGHTHDVRQHLTNAARCWCCRRDTARERRNRY